MRSKWYTVKVYWEDKIEGETFGGEIEVAMFADFSDARDYARAQLREFQKWASFACVSIWHNEMPVKEFLFRKKR